MTSHKHTHVIVYEDYIKTKKDTIEDPREQDHTIANIATGEYPKELIETLDKLKEESTKLMDMRIKYLKIKRVDMKERENARRELVHQYRKTIELENEFQRLINYEERNYTETI